MTPLAMTATIFAATIFAATVMSAVPIAAAAGPPQATLVHGVWRLETPLGAAAGPVLVVWNHETVSWRCEIAVAEDSVWPAGDELLERRGRGWTLTSTPDGSFVQPWDGPWRQLGGAAARSVGALIDRWLAGDLAACGEARAGPRRWRSHDRWRPLPVVLEDWAGLPADWRPRKDGPEVGGDLRRRLVGRGRGRGGDGLVLDLGWEGDDLIATSARWPGRIVLRLTGTEPGALPAEAYLPLWPLAEFLP